MPRARQGYRFHRNANPSNPSNHWPAANRIGFTLIELLVVISIIALLIGILIPVLSKAREAGRQVKCASTVKQIGAGLEMYANDHRGYYPVPGSKIEWGEVDTNTGEPSWMEQMGYYIDATDKDVAQEKAYNGCPSYPVETPWHFFLSGRAAYVEAGGTFAATRRTRISQPSNFILAGDNNFSQFTEPDADKDDYTQRTLSFEADDEHWEPQHNGGLNLLFVDNHVSLHREFDETNMTLFYDEMSDWK